jgi:hypothetical protein
MTLTMAWVRQAGATEELVIASDSRLRAGYAWDASPKLLPMPRGDSVLAFAGRTDFAYPLMIQAWNAVSSWNRALARTQPLPVMKGHLLRVFDGMLAELSDLPRFGEAMTPDAIFLLAGYSWSENRFRIWTLHYDKSVSKFAFKPASPWRGETNRGKVLAMVGDHVAEARDLLVELLRRRRKLSAGMFDFEPLEVLYSMTRNEQWPTIGGSVQIVKVYRSLNAVPFVVRDTESGVLSLLGRPLLSYETPDRFPLLEIGASGVIRAGGDDL